MQAKASAVRPTPSQGELVRRLLMGQGGVVVQGYGGVRFAFVPVPRVLRPDAPTMAEDARPERVSHMKVPRGDSLTTTQDARAPHPT